MKVYFVLILILKVTPIIAQSTYDLFFEEFNNNSNRWVTGDRARTKAYISEGLFYLESKRSNFNYSRRIEQGYLRPNQDYEISIRIRQVKGDDKRGYALEWGGSSLANSFYEFWVRKDGKFSIDYFDGSLQRFTDFIPWTYSSAIKQDEFNVLKVIKDGDRTQYLINDVQVFEMKNLLLRGSEIGFIAPPLGAVEVDYLNVKLLNEVPSPVFDRHTVPKIHVVIVGVADYQSNQFIKDLSFTVNDARILSNFYLSQNGGGVSEGSMVVLLNKQATKENIVNKTRSLFRKAKANDMIVFYFSGHGDLLQEENEQTLQLIPYEYNGNLKGSAIPISTIESIFNASGANKKLLMLDACHSGGTLPDMKGRFLHQLSSLEDKDIAILTSSNLGETSLEAVSLGEGRGLFSYFLTNALIYNSTDCDTDNNGVISILELFNYVKTGVSRTAEEKYYHRQTPQIGGRFNIQLPLAEVSY